LESLWLRVSYQREFQLRLLLDETRIVTMEEHDRVMNVNSRGLMMCFKYAAMQMIKQGNGGRIIGKFCLKKV
jgi:NAD(P)-dependent dehydrogenase (short-subunit alcohol dehydrogenase family)